MLKTQYQNKDQSTLNIEGELIRIISLDSLRVNLKFKSLNLFYHKISNFKYIGNSIKV